MHALTHWFIRNPVAANLLMGLILVAGFLGATQMRIEGFPKIPPDAIGISVTYPGASASQVDETVTRKLEKALQGLPGVKRLISSSTPMNAYVQVKATEGYPLPRLLEAVKARLETVSGLPQLAERPVIRQEAFEFPALIVQVYGAVEQEVLQRSGRQVKAALLAHPDITKISHWGEKTPEIRIELDPQRLQAHDLGYTEVAARINQASLLHRSGTLSTDAGSIGLRADHQAYHWQDFASLPVITGADGRQLRLGDLGEIVDGFAQTESQVRYQGVPAIGLEIRIDGKGNLLHVSASAREVVAQLQPLLPAGVQVAIWADQSGYIADRLALLKSNAVQGLVLVLVILSLFLQVRLAFWVAMGIPVSIAGTLWLMGWDTLDYSLNDITTFGMILVLGLLVDDAIVVGESVHRERQLTPDAILGTQRGVDKVATATLFGVLTTMAAFYPLLLLENPLGKVLGGFSAGVIIALFFSLLESKCILPAHLAAIDFHRPPGTSALARAWQRLQQTLDGLLQQVIVCHYRPALALALRYRHASLVLLLTLAMLGIGLGVTGVVRSSFFPDVPGSLIRVTLAMDPQSPFALTRAHTLHLEQMAQAVNEEVTREYALAQPPIARVMTAISGAHQVEIYAELAPEAGRGPGTLALVQRWRQRTGVLEGARELDFSATEALGGGFALTLNATDESRLRTGVEQVSRALAGLKGVSDVRDDLKGAAPEIQLHLTPQAGLLGVTQEQLANDIANRYGGLEVQRLQRNGDEIRVLLRHPDEARDSLGDLLQAQIRTPQGQWVGLTEVASLESRYVPGVIWRRNGERAATVYARLDKSRVSAAEVLAQLQAGVIPELARQLPDLRVRAAGELAEEGELQGGLKEALILALLLIYALLAVPLKSYTQPFIIMGVIPFALAGAVAGHLIAGISLSLLSFFGMLALTGIVVNDSLVLLTTYNQLRAEGMARDQALVEAGARRFRAIFLTTFTTLAGLAPLLLETSEQAQYLIPAAVSLVYGELFATLITLFAVPLLVGCGGGVLANASSAHAGPGEHPDGCQSLHAPVGA